MVLLCLARAAEIKAICYINAYHGIRVIIFASILRAASSLLPEETPEGRYLLLLDLGSAAK